MSMGNLRKKRGLTLVEVMVAMFVSVIIIASVITSAVFAKQQSEVSKTRLSATIVLNQLCEENRLTPFSTLKTNLLSTGYLSGSTVIHNRTYNWTRVSVDMSSQTSESDMIRIETTVSWSILNQRYNVMSDMYISKYGTNPRSQL